MKAPLPLDEPQRLEALREYGILDTPPEQAYDDITRLAAQICQVPMAMISLVDDNRQWFKSRVGVTAEETSRDFAFCAHTILYKDEMLEVRDTEADPRFSDSPLVTSDPHVRFYAGAPLVTADGHALGALCVMDRAPHTLTEDQRTSLLVLSRHVVAHLDLRRKSRLLADEIAEHRGAAALLRGQFQKISKSKIETDGLLALADKSRRALLSVIEDERQTGQSLRQSEERFRQLAEYITDVFWIASPDLEQIHYVSPEYERIWGRSAESLYAHPHQWVEAILPEERAQVFGVFGTLMADEPSVSVEYRIARPDGTVRWVHDRGFQVRDATGHLVRLTGIVTDITERKRVEEQIAEQAAFLDKARDAILVRDLEGKILYWNEGAKRMYGWAREEVIGLNVSDLLYTAQKKFEEVNGLTISQGEWMGELKHQTMNRGEITVEARWTLIRDNEGHPKSVLAINTDVTERKKIEAQFLRAQRMESIGTLAGGVAHDLNNILAPIMMAVEVLKSFSDDPQALSILETLEVSAKRGADIVRQVLSFARGAEGVRVEIQPRQQLEDIENIIRDTFPKDIRLRFSVPGDTWAILGDPTQMHQILLNLCVNARDAMPNGGTLTVGAENLLLDEHYSAMNIDARPGRYVIVSVTDTGTGIPPAVLDKIFEPFFTTKDLNKGTGLGLSTVIAIVKSHEGFVNVYSEPGHGTTFKVYLPATETSSEGREQKPQAANLPRGNGETILVVDDEASIRTITSQTLETFGYQVLAAADGAEAVALYAQHKHEIAAVLTDMMMPIMDGPATVHALMRINPAVKIIAASGLNSSGEAARASGAGIKHFLLKPYTAETLLKMLRTVLEQS